MQKVEILFFADSHLGFDHPIKRGSTVRRGPDFFRNFNHILNEATTSKVDLVIHGGDLFDRADVHRSIVDKAYDAIFAFADSGIPIILVPGNHDRSTLPTNLFLQHPNIHIFRQPDVFHFEISGFSLHIAGFPYVRNIGLEIEAIIEQISGQIFEGDINLLCMHQAVEGATVGPADYTFRPGHQVISMSQLKGPYQAYLSGHIHPHQVLSTGGLHPKPFIYPGSIERTSFAEKDERKGYTLLTLENGKDPRIVFKEVSTRPMYVLQPNLQRHSKDELIRDILFRLSQLPKNSIVRVECQNQATSQYLSGQSFRQSIPKEMIIRSKPLWLPNPFTPKKI